MRENRELVLDIYEKVSGASDKDWIEICKEHGLDCHPDTLRKAGYGIKIAADAGVLDFEKAPINVYDETYKSKKQFYDQRREYNKLLTEAARWEHIRDELKASVARLNMSVPILPTAGQKTCMGESTEGIAVFSDIHYGLVTNNVFNQYDSRIAQDRIAQYAVAIIERIRLHKVRCLHIILLGDLIHGDAHVSCRVAASEGAVDQLMNISEILSQTIAHLSRYVEEVHVYSTWGNHARVVQNLGDSIHDDNLERLLPWYLEYRLANLENVTVEDSNAYELIGFDCCGLAVCASHGDLDSKKDAPLALSLIYERNFGRKMDILITGHMHTPFNTEQLGIDHIGSGSLSGTDEYAKDKRLFSRPSQTMLILNPKDGVDARYNISFRT